MVNLSRYRSVLFVATIFVLTNIGHVYAQYIPPGFVALDTLPHLRFDLRYTSKKNFTGTELYPADWRSSLHPIAAERLRKAAMNLQKQKPGWSIVIFDALRPQSIQKQMYDVVRNTPMKRYVASPKGSIHNYGLALDVTLADENGRPIDMGTDYDNFTSLAEPRFEAQNLAKGKLSKVQLANRKLLRDLMRQAGLRPIRNEWWHFEAVRKKELGGRFTIVK